MDNQEQWVIPEFFFSTVLSYIHSTSKDEFEALEMDDAIHIPVVGGEYVITKKELLEKVQQEVQQYKDAGEK
jgi:hypothetical protein